MKVLIIDYPWKKTWLSLYANAIIARGHEICLWDGKSNVRVKPPDVVFCTWADRTYTELFPNARHVMMMRRFEFFHAPWQKYDWNKISDIICCNPWIADKVRAELKHTGTRVHYINNPIDLSKWTVKERSFGNRVGMVCRIHAVKNLPLAAQIIMASGGYVLHIAGETNDQWIETYMRHILGDSLVLHGRVPNHRLDEWWSKMDFCLSTSMTEGDPMCVLEACAKGIKPIIHNWPGASDMYPKEWVFDTVEDAVGMIYSDDYNRKQYREFVEKERSVDLADKVAEIVCDGILGDSDSSKLSSSPGGRGSLISPRPPFFNEYNEAVL